MIDYLAAAQVAIKWKECRDSVYKLKTIFDKENGPAKYKEDMAFLQNVIKALAAKENKSIIVTTIDMCKGKDDTSVIYLLAAAYELTNNNDFTIKK